MSRLCLLPCAGDGACGPVLVTVPVLARSRPGPRPSDSSSRRWSCGLAAANGGQVAAPESVRPTRRGPRHRVPQQRGCVRQHHRPCCGYQRWHGRAPAEPARGLWGGRPAVRRPNAQQSCYRTPRSPAPTTKKQHRHTQRASCKRTQTRVQMSPLATRAPASFAHAAGSSS